MTRIDRMDQLLDSLRQQLLQKVEARGADASSAASAARLKQGAPQRAETSEELRRRIGRELRSHDLSTAVGRRRARISFLESVLGWDLGDVVLRDPQFGTLVQTIEETIGQDSQVSRQLDELLAMLIQRS